MKKVSLTSSQRKTRIRITTEPWHLPLHRLVYFVIYPLTLYLLKTVVVPCPEARWGVLRVNRGVMDTLVGDWIRQSDGDGTTDGYGGTTGRQVWHDEPGGTIEGTICDSVMVIMTRWWLRWRLRFDDSFPILLFQFSNEKRILTLSFLQSRWYAYVFDTCNQWMFLFFHYSLYQYTLHFPKTPKSQWR